MTPTASSFFPRRNSQQNSSNPGIHKLDYRRELDQQIAEKQRLNSSSHIRPQTLQFSLSSKLKFQSTSGSREKPQSSLSGILPEEDRKRQQCKYTWMFDFRGKFGLRTNRFLVRLIFEHQVFSTLNPWF